MIDQNQVYEFQKLLEKANSVMVVFGEKPSLDIMSSAASIYLAIKKMGKEVTLLHPSGSSQLDADISGLNEANYKLGNKNLVVSFDYEKGKIGDVGYHINEETKKFYLTIKPTKGSKPLDSKKVEFHYTEAEADLVILVGVHDLKSLGNLYEGYKSFYEETDLVAIHKFDVPMGRVKINTSGFVCISEAIAQLMLSLKMEITPEIATNLLMGLEAATDDFRSLATTGTTFAIASHLMKYGARRIRRRKSSSTSLFTSKLLKTGQKKSTKIGVTSVQPVEVKTGKDKSLFAKAMGGETTIKPEADQAAEVKLMEEKPSVVKPKTSKSKIPPKRIRPTFKPSLLK